MSIETEGQTLLVWQNANGLLDNILLKVTRNPMDSFRKISFRPLCPTLPLPPLSTAPSSMPHLHCGQYI